MATRARLMRRAHNLGVMGPTRIGVIAGVVALLTGCEAGLGASPPLGGTPLRPSARSSGCVARGAEPDPGCTPGSVLSSDRARICTAGYAHSVRDVSYALKRRVYAAYGIRHHARGAYEVDHLVPLELGGGNDFSNLWPEAADPRPGFHEKDALENRLHDLVCAGQLGLATAQRAIARDWLAARRRYGA
jgi:hypothetical protein